MSADPVTLVRDPEHGYHRLDPIPSEEELDRFYGTAYHEVVRDGARAPDLQRLAAGGEEAEREREWLRGALHADVVAILAEVGRPNGRLLDVGCSTGEFLASARAAGYEVVGLEPSASAAERAQGRGLEVHRRSPRAFADELPARRGAFDVVTLLHVLEHLPSPGAALDATHDLLAPDGVIVIQVPNDFSELQEAARRAIDRPPWWIAIPDHVHYFDFASLRSLLSARRFGVIREQATFPMELFLLMGDDYVGVPSVGAACHARRRRFEIALPGPLRRRLYGALAAAGAGRDCLVFARREPR